MLASLEYALFQRSHKNLCPLPASVDHDGGGGGDGGGDGGGSGGGTGGGTGFGGGDVLGNCPLVQPPQWGAVRERVLEDGTLQTVYSCEVGRRLKGHKVATCTANGWDHPVPKCVLLALLVTSTIATTADYDDDIVGVLVNILVAG
ncbi:hypothetical protein HZH66_004211 [Vespula vulgaris]|uniref:Sushi domain-containing protein n=1 Tax=Vespula vulgaris TaxID=7454 RepID=A0A834NDU3_VESVU|nr:hypothetical protein HZH66_004211 [Vespula vulgaris]